MYLAKVAMQFSTLDQENVDALIGRWKKKSLADAFFYRPHTGDAEAMKNERCVNDVTSYQMRFLIPYHQPQRATLFVLA